MSTHQQEFAGQVNWGTEAVAGLSASALPSAYDSSITIGIPGQILPQASAKPVSQQSSGLGGRQMYSKEQWEIKKPVIYRLYNQENKSYNRVTEILHTEHNFFPTRRQFYRKISEWGFEKNIKESEMRAIAQGLEQGEMGGPTELKGRQIDAAKILRWQKRQGRFKGAVRPLTNIPGHIPMKNSSAATNERESLLPTAQNSARIPVNSTSFSPNEAIEASQSLSIWATVDVPGSPSLSRLFKALQIECPTEIPPLSIGSPLAESAVPYIADTEIEDISKEEEIDDAVEKRKTGRTVLSSCSSMVLWKETSPSRQPEWNLPNESFDEWAFSQWDFLKGQPVHIEIKMGPTKPISPFPTSHTTVARGTPNSRLLVLSREGPALDAKEAVYKNRLRILKRSFSEDDPRILRTMSDLADIYRRHCKYRQSDRFFRHVAISMRRIHGFKHRETLSAYLEVVKNLSGQGNYRLAAKIQEPVHATILSHIGTEDSLALESTIVLSSIYFGLSKDGKADKLYRQILQIRLNTLGPRHVETLEVMRHFARLLRFSGKSLEGEKLLSTIFQLQDEAEGIQWQDICYNELELARVLINQKRYREGKTLALKAAERLEILLGPEAQDTSRCYICVAECLEQLGQYAESESILKTTLEQQLTRLGESHTRTADTMFYLATVLEKGCRGQEAVSHYEMCFRIEVENFGLENPRAIGTCSRLGLCYEGLGRYEDAFGLYQRTFDQLRSTNPEDHPAVVEVCSWIGQLRDILATGQDAICHE